MVKAAPNGSRGTKCEIMMITAKYDEIYSNFIPSIAVSAFSQVGEPRDLIYSSEQYCDMTLSEIRGI